MNVNLYSVLKLNAFKGIQSDQLCRISMDIVDKTAQVTVQPVMTVGDLCTLAKNTLFPTSPHTFKDVNIVSGGKPVKKTFTLQQAKITDGSTVQVQFTVVVA